MYLLASEMPLFFIVLSWEGKGLWISFHHVNSLYIGSRCLKDNVNSFVFSPSPRSYVERVAKRRMCCFIQAIMVHVLGRKSSPEMVWDTQKE